VSGAFEAVDARFELAPLDFGQPKRVEASRRQELKIAHLPSTAGNHAGARARARGGAAIVYSTAEQRFKAGLCGFLQGGGGGGGGWGRRGTPPTPQT
jgi:hypothetical protein